MPTSLHMIALGLACGLLALTGIGWVRLYGSTRGCLAIFLRTLWLVPIFASLWPRTVSEEISAQVSRRQIHLFLDDSTSMKAEIGGETPFAEAQKLVGALEQSCRELACTVKTTLLSAVDHRTADGFSPLSAALPLWAARTGADPWVVVSDGGDFRPEAPWDDSLRGAGQPIEADKGPRGLIVGFAARMEENVAIEDVDLAPFGFEGKPFEITVHVNRNRAMATNQTIQVQALLGDNVLGSINGSFVKDDLNQTLTILVPTLPRGTQLVTVRVLPTGGERYLWDNTVLRSVEVMPNTVGILHLLGAPSWDGRFLRRYLKSEPKYDLISFYILRDPWDSQQANERELSLIPFPVERLFRDELPSFRACLIQNFSLSQFLQPEYQENLVRYVQDGGGLLFIGGPRALRQNDLVSSPLRSILPFDPQVPEQQKSGGLGGFSGLDGLVDGELLGPRDDEAQGTTYNPDAKFRIVAGRPTAAQRALASVYDEWEPLLHSLESAGQLQGMQNTGQFRFKDKEVTPLLNAKLESGQTQPLVVASYPGKGRALWVFSDELWRLAMSESPDVPRSVYNRFISAAMTWLLRQDLRPPLVARNLVINSDPSQDEASWSVQVQGPASRYLEPSKEWTVETCGVRSSLDMVELDRVGTDEWILRGKLGTRLRGGQRCQFVIQGSHGAFGSVKAEAATLVPRVLSDQEIDRAPAKLASLARLTKGRLSAGGKDRAIEVRDWLQKALGAQVDLVPQRFRTKLDPYWFLGEWWVWLCLLALPAEVLIRRWHEWFGGGRIRRTIPTGGR